MMQQETDGGLVLGSDGSFVLVLTDCCATEESCCVVIDIVLFLDQV